MARLFAPSEDACQLERQGARYAVSTSFVIPEACEPCGGIPQICDEDTVARKNLKRKGGAAFSSLGALRAHRLQYQYLLDSKACVRSTFQHCPDFVLV